MPKHHANETHFFVPSNVGNALKCGEWSHSDITTLQSRLSFVQRAQVVVLGENRGKRVTSSIFARTAAKTLKHLGFLLQPQLVNPMIYASVN